MTALERIGIGTAQFGSAYGATNTRGQVGIDAARQILDFARQGGARVIDTASGYGDSEHVLGLLADTASGFRIVTKTPVLGVAHVGAVEAARMRTALDQSRRRLRRDCIDAVLVHHAREILLPGGTAIIETLRAAQDRGEIDTIGVSVYAPDELEQILPVFTPDLVQLPLNLLDQRFQRSGLIDRLKRLGAEVHARSLFLQGTLLVSPRALPAYFGGARSAFERIAGQVASAGLSPLAACLSFGLSVSGVDCLILGVASLDELKQITAALGTLPPTLPDFSGLAIDDTDIVDPSRWRV